MSERTEKVLTCDSCGTESSDDGAFWVGGHPHTGWLHVSLGKNQPPENGEDFCSKECLVRHYGTPDDPPKVRCFKWDDSYVWVFGCTAGVFIRLHIDRIVQKSCRTAESLANDDMGYIEITLSEAIALVAKWPEAVEAVLKEVGL